MSVSQEVMDTVELVRHLQTRFGQSRVYLVGHSYGSYLGMILAQRHPELFRAYVGIGQLAYDGERNTDVQDRWIREHAERNGNRKLLADLDNRRPVNREKWLFRFGGAIHKSRSFTTLIVIGLMAPEYTLKEGLDVRKGVNFTHRNLKYDAIQGALAEAIPRVDLPVYFFTGRYDLTDPFQNTVEYEKKLEAPRKEIVWFEESAHFPFLEEPEKFAREMCRVKAESERRSMTSHSAS